MSYLKLVETYTRTFLFSPPFQIINVYNQEYESAGAFWPHVHSRIIASLLISQLLLLGLLGTKKAAYSTPLLIFLPVLTLWFHSYCKSRFEPAFRKYPLEVRKIQYYYSLIPSPPLSLIKTSMLRTKREMRVFLLWFTSVFF